MSKRPPGEPTPYAKAKAEARDLRSDVFNLSMVLARRIAEEIPDVTRVWKGSDHTDPNESCHDTTVTINWWGSCRADEGVVEIIIDNGERRPDVAVMGALPLRDRVRTWDGYSAPWRYEIQNMLAIGLSERERIARERVAQRKAGCSP